LQESKRDKIKESLHNETKMRVLVFGAHADDETFGMGGTIYKHVQRGDDVAVVIMTNGETGTGGREISPGELIELREEEAKSACGVLGVNDIRFLGFKDSCLFLNETTFETIVKIIRDYRPDTIYVHYGDASLSQDNLDHINAHNIVVISAFMAKMPALPKLGKKSWNVSEIYVYEGLSPMPEPSVFIDISDVIDIKIKAIQEYKSQLVNVKRDELIIALNHFRGLSSSRVEYAEAFKVIKTKIF